MYCTTDLYKRKELVPHMDNDLDASSSTPGSLRRSKGWKLKVTDNPRMNKDCRNQPFVLSTDGIPFFNKDGFNSGRGCWPGVLRAGSLPDGLWNDPTNCHLCLFAANEYVERIGADTRPVVVSRHCCTTICCIFVFVDLFNNDCMINIRVAENRKL